MSPANQWIYSVARREFTKLWAAWARIASPEELADLAFTIIAGLIIGTIFGQIARLPL